MKILIADDDPVVRAIVQRVVGQTAHDFIEAEDGLVALQIIEHEDPDVLITDLHMPVLDGFELVTAVRSSALHRAMPIVCLSAVNDREAIGRLAALGITDYLLKPIRPRDLADRLAAVTTKYAKWKLDRNPVGAEATAAVVLVIDPDVAFRSVVTSTLAPDFAVVDAASGPNGVTAFRGQPARVTTVLVSEGLELLNEERVAGLLRRLATDQGVTPPVVLLVTAADVEVDPEKAANFDGIIRRTLVADELVAALTPWLPKAAPCSPA